MSADIARLYDILRRTCQEFRKGDEVVTKQQPGVEVTEVFMMPHESEALPVYELVDLHFIKIGVDKETAPLFKDEVQSILKELAPQCRLEDGPSYISVGAVIGDQGAALCLFALGKVMGLWDIVTPATVFASGAMADQMAGSGFIMCAGWRADR
jgi:hypothetical protein